MIKCPHCGKEFEESDNKTIPWYYSDVCVVIAILVLGPLALRLIWRNPRYTPMVKTIITVIVIVITVLVIVKFYEVMQSTTRQLQELGF
ncbi:MAG: DUF983 domain-containing protein [Sedimentisphaerales bacterium]|nr:DUF983 domain-containing protein [Sedimentisphaerales bacterium]